MMGSEKKFVTVLGVISDLDIKDNELSNQLERGLELIPGKLKLRFLTENDRDVYEQKKLIEKRETYKKKMPVFELEDATMDGLGRDPFNLLDLAVLALKLINTGNPYIEDIYAVPQEVPTRSNVKILMVTIPGEYYNWNIPYELSSNDIYRLKDLLQRLTCIDFDKENWYAIACQRFHKSFENQLPADTLIDYCIAFEALFIRGDRARTGIGETIGLGCSMLLGNDNRERYKISKNIQYLFELRNKVVHGREFKSERLDFEKKNAIEDYLRRSLVKLLPA